jgi:GST-like protein
MSETPTYTPPKVWTWNKPNGGKFASINRPISGPTHDKELPVGRHPLQLYSLATPNGVKVTILLEELLALGHKGAEYDAWLIRINDGEQFGSGFVGVNPNSKIPALMDRSGAKPIRVFESGAILMYLAEKFDAFLPTEPAARAECLSWLFWQMGSAPYLGGGFGHFYAYAPTKIEYAIDRFAMEAKRELDVLDRRLAVSEYIAGDSYTIADMAIFPWYGGTVKGWQYDAAEFLSVHEYKNILRWADQLLTRPAVKRGRKVNRIRGELSQTSCTNAMTRATSTRSRRTSWRRRGERTRRCGMPEAVDAQIPLKFEGYSGEGAGSKIVTFVIHIMALGITKVTYAHAPCLPSGRSTRSAKAWRRSARCPAPATVADGSGR